MVKQRMKDKLVVSLITLGDPEQITGGYLYQHRLAERAAGHKARLGFVSVPDRPFPLPMLSGAKAIKDALKDALGERPGVVLVDSIAAAFVAPFVLRQRLPAPVCALLHQPPGGIGHGIVRRRFQTMMDMLLYRRAELLIVASQMLADEMQSRWHVDPQRLRIVPPGRDAVANPPCATLPFDLRSGTAASFLCVANWLPPKGIHTLLEAFSLLPPVAGVLHLVGDNRVDPSYSRRISRRIAQPDLVARVHVHGTLPPPDICAFYRAADVFVLPSHKETYGTVYGEAMSAGLPIVGLRAGNLPNLIKSGIQGLLVDPADVAGLAKALLTLACDQQLRQRMGEAARERARNFPTWDDSANAFFAALRGVALAVRH